MFEDDEEKELQENRDVSASWTRVNVPDSKTQDLGGDTRSIQGEPIFRNPARLESESQSNTAQPRHAALLRFIAVASLYLFANLFLDKISLSLRASSGLSLKYLPEGLSMSLLLGYGLTFAPLLLVRPFLSGLWIYPVKAGFPVLLFLGALSACIYSGASALLKKRLHAELRYPTLRDLARFTGVVLAASLLVSSLSAFVLTALGYAPKSDLLMKVFRLWMGDGLGIVSLTPFLLVNVLPRLKGILKPDLGKVGNAWVTPFAKYEPETFPNFSWNSLPELGFQAIGIILASALVFSPWINQAFHHYYFCFIPIIWIALRRGLRGASLGVLAVNIGILIAISEWETTLKETADLQLFILTITLTSLFLGAAVSDRKRAAEALRESERRLRQAQKMDAVDRLAGGIAHDFNNLLTAINGYSDILIDLAEAGTPIRRGLEEIKKAGERAAELTADLLTFSRKRVITLSALNLNSLLSGMDSDIRLLAGNKIKISYHLDPGPCWLKADAVQMEKAVINLATNACDAMPGGGSLRIATMKMDIKEMVPCFNGSIEPGPYACLMISDKGKGMSPETQSQIFDPFFTTKDSAHESGLGLSAVYGIVEQLSGRILVNSRLGEGTTVRLFFPSITPPEKKPQRAFDGDQFAANPGETILLVEDDDVLRELIRTILMKNGYTVREAGSAEDAIRIFEQTPCDLILSDVVLRGMNGGRQLADALRNKKSNIPIIMMSGYSTDEMLNRGFLDSSYDFLAKPFTNRILLRKVRDTLDATYNQFFGGHDEKP